MHVGSMSLPHHWQTVFIYYFYYNKATHDPNQYGMLYYDIKIDATHASNVTPVNWNKINISKWYDNMIRHSHLRHTYHKCNNFKLE